MLTKAEDTLSQISCTSVVAFSTLLKPPSIAVCSMSKPIFVVARRKCCLTVGLKYKNTKRIPLCDVETEACDTQEVGIFMRLHYHYNIEIILGF